MPDSQSDLTKRQEDFCRFVDSYQQKHDGLSPSLDEIAKGMNLKDRCSARSHFHLISKKGYVTHNPGSPRSIRLTEKWHRHLNMKMNRVTNPMVDEVAETHPELFDGWTDEEWNELRSVRGMGGDMTVEGVLREAKRIAENRELLQRFQELLICQSTRAKTIDWLDEIYGEIDVERRLAEMRNQN